MILFGFLVLTALLTVWVVVRYKAVLHEQMMAIPSYRRTLRAKETKGSRLAISVSSWVHAAGGKRFWGLPVLGAALGAVIGRVGFNSISVGAIAGVFMPWLVSLWIKRYLEKEYLQQVKDTMRFMESTFSSGGQIEDILEELVKRTHGRMKREVQSAVALQRNGTPMRDILINWNRITNEPHFAFALRSIADVLKDAGDLITVMSESIVELQRDEQFKEALMVVTRSSWTNLIMVMSFPAVCCLLFHHVVVTELQEMPWLFVVLVIGGLALAGILLWFRRVSRI